MKIYNQSKTIELFESTLDFDKGYLLPDRLVIAHHEAVQAQEAIYAERIVEEPSGGMSVYKDLVAPAVEAKEAYDEYEDIQVYVLYTAEELLDNKRTKREPLLNAFDKWEKAVLRGREQDDYSIMIWYQDLLNLQDVAFTMIPERIKYYL